MGIREFLKDVNPDLCNRGTFFLGADKPNCPLGYGLHKKGYKHLSMGDSLSTLRTEFGISEQINNIFYNSYSNALSNGDKKAALEKAIDEAEKIEQLEIAVEEAVTD